MRLAAAAEQAAERVALAQDVLFEVLGGDDDLDSWDDAQAEIRRICLCLGEAYDDLKEIALE